MQQGLPPLNIWPAIVFPNFFDDDIIVIFAALQIIIRVLIFRIKGDYHGIFASFSELDFWGSFSPGLLFLEYNRMPSTFSAGKPEVGRAAALKVKDNS